MSGGSPDTRYEHSGPLEDSGTIPNSSSERVGRHRNNAARSRVPAETSRKPAPAPYIRALVPTSPAGPTGAM